MVEYRYGVRIVAVVIGFWRTSGTAVISAIIAARSHAVSVVGQFSPDTTTARVVSPRR